MTYTEQAQIILGYIEVRYPNNYHKVDKDAELNVWSQELSRKQFKAHDLTEKNIYNALDYHSAMTNNSGRPPSIDQFCQALKKFTYQESKQLEVKEINWYSKFDHADNKGKFTFFMRNTFVPPALRYYARCWFEKHTKFTQENIKRLINGKLPKSS